MSAEIIPLFPTPAQTHATKLETERYKHELYDMIETQIIGMSVMASIDLHKAKKDVAEYQASLPVRFDPNF